jgi:chromosome segregation ATPase
MDAAHLINSIPAPVWVFAGAALTATANYLNGLTKLFELLHLKKNGGTDPSQRDLNRAQTESVRADTRSREIATIDRVLDAYDRLADEKLQHEEEYRATTAALRAELNDTALKLDALGKQYEVLRATMEETAGERLRDKQEIARLTAQVAELQRQLAEERAEKVDLITRLDALQRTINEVSRRDSNKLADAG